MKDTEQIRALLLAEQKNVLERVDSLAGQIEDLTSARRGLNDDDEHDPEGVTLSSEWSMLAGLLKTARTNAEQLEAAIVRLDAGKYGSCVACGQPIPEQQLEVRPFREKCVSCAG
ncbi:MAG: TraR/DksA C4-type zinc finger protein [Microbacteriaceae bacterium]